MLPLTAFYRLEFKIIGRSKRPGSRLSETRSPVSYAAYRAGERLVDEKLNLAFDYTLRKGIYHTEIITPSNAPQWTSDRSILWNTVQSTEKRKDAQLAREVLISLPKELNIDLCKKLVGDFVKKVFVSEGMIADIAIHEPSKNIKNQNIHAHIMLTMRSIDRDGFGKKERGWNSKRKLNSWRESWCEITNLYLERAGLECRVDHRNRANIELEQARHFDYSVGDWAINDGEPQIIEITTNYSSEDHIDLYEKIGSQDDLVRPQELIMSKGEDADYAKIFTSNVYNSSFEQIQQEFKLLLDLMQNEFVTNKERKAEFDKLAIKIKHRLLMLQSTLIEWSESKLKDRLRLQIQIEESYYNEYSNNIQAILFEADEPKKYASDISACKNRAKIYNKEYQQRIAEWNSRATRYNDYLPTSPSDLEKVNRIRDAELKKWSNLAIKSQKNNWDQTRILREERILQRKLDSELSVCFDPKLSLSMGR